MTEASKLKINLYQPFNMIVNILAFGFENKQKESMINKK